MASGDTIGLGRPCRICIDPGHGGRDTGAVANGVVEKTVNLSVALTLRDLLEANDHTVTMTRTVDEWMGLTDRGCFSVRHDSELFVSVHHDWVQNRDTRGCSAFVRYEQYRNGMDLGTKLAESLDEQFDHGFTYGVPCRKHWVNLGVLRGCNNDGLVTATVVELACLTNPTDASMTQWTDYPDQATKAIVRGIHRHLGLPEPGQPAPETVPVMIVEHETGDVIATYQMVPRGDHVEDQRKLYVRTEV